VPDLRNSKVADLIGAFRQLGHDVDVHDPLVSVEESRHEYGMDLIAEPQGPYDLVVLAVPHRELVQDFDRFAGLLAQGGAVADLKNVLSSDGLPAGTRLWTL